MSLGEKWGETETMKMAPRRDQSRGLESRLQALVHKYQYVSYASSTSPTTTVFNALDVDSASATTAKSHDASQSLQIWQSPIELILFRWKLQEGSWRREGVWNWCHQWFWLIATYQYVSYTTLSKATRRVVKKKCLNLVALIILSDCYVPICKLYYFVEGKKCLWKYLPTTKLFFEFMK